MSADVVIVGGGIAGLTAAFELTDPVHCRARAKGCTCRGGGRREDCSLPEKVSVYELRNVLGGKGASVRNRELGDRIEEHGLHIWFGYYENAFRLLDRCHRALDEISAQGGPDRWSTALTHVAEGFRPASTVGLADDDLYGTWSRWWTRFPEDDSLPWNRNELDQPAEFDLHWFLPELGRRTTALLHAAMRSLITGNDPGELARTVQAGDVALSDIDPALDRLFSAALRWSDYLRRRSAEVPRAALVTVALASLRANDQLLDYVRESRDLDIAGNATACRLMTVIDLLVGATRGLLDAGIATDADIDRLDDWEWSEWLAANGVLGVSRDSSLVRALSYCLPFAYERGSRDLPSFSAAIGLRLFLRTFFTYRGALMWKMNHGMGEVVFAPLYELLKKRGVVFKFEHELVRVEIEKDVITNLHFRRPRATGAEVDPCPLVRLQLDTGTLCCWARVERRARTERVECQTSKSRVVLALPLPALARAAKRLFKTKRWEELRDGRERYDGYPRVGLASVATRAAQLWLTEPAADVLGWPDDVTVSGFSEPYDTFSDMSELLGSEGPPEQGPVPRGLVYLCSSRPEEKDTRLSERDELNLFLRDRAAYLWPSAVTARGTLDPTIVIGVKHAGPVLMHQSADRSAPRAPYVRKNTAPTDRYILSLPGTAVLRIDPGNSGLDNLFVAGDWTACVLNAGCIEAATISGMLAAEAMLETELSIIGRSVPGTSAAGDPDGHRGRARNRELSLQDEDGL